MAPGAIRLSGGAVDLLVWRTPSVNTPGRKIPMPPLRTVMTALAMLAAAASFAADKDPYLWLEDVEGKKALDWVKERSAKDTAEIEAVPEFAPIHAELLEIFNSRERIPNVSMQGAWLYNFWQDAEHVRGVWRRTFLDQYVQASPVWETVLDVDALAKAEGENWVWQGADGLPPDYTRYLVTLSRGGGDAAVTREFDAVTKTFVAGRLRGARRPRPASAGRTSDTVWIGTDFGAGSLTKSGYPRLVKEWRRGTPLASARLVFEGSRGRCLRRRLQRPHPRGPLRPRQPHAGVLPRRELPGPRRPPREDRRAGRRRDARHLQEPAAPVPAHRLDRRRHDVSRRTPCSPSTSTASSPARATSRCSSSPRRAWPSTASAPRSTISC